MERENVFAVSFGTYVGCLLAPATALAVPAPTWPILLAGVVLFGTGGYLMARRLDLVMNLTGVWRNASMVLFPFAYLPRAVMRPPGLSPAEFFTTPAFVGVFAALPGFVAVLTAYDCRNRWAMSAATVHAEFEARSAPKARRWRYVGGGAVLLSGVLSAALFALGEGENPGAAIGAVATAMGSFTALAAAKDDEREVAITDAGVKVQSTVHDWDTFADYEVTETALVLERPKRWHATFEFDREDVENLDEVDTALRRYLPRERTR